MIGSDVRFWVDEAISRLRADRGTLYILDRARNELVSQAAHLPELAEIRLRFGEGVAGWVARRGQVLNVALSDRDPRFSRRIDRLTGYRTRSILAAPVRSTQGAIIGVLQVLNKASGTFNREDERGLAALAAEIGEHFQRPSDARFPHIIGDSAPMREVYDRTARAARTFATVLVRGASGSGKELIARALHAHSARRDGPFVKVDCAALPSQLIENELFGHERGAYTGAVQVREGKVASADGGTLFLDEIGELPLEVQGKLLRLLQDRTFIKVGGVDVQRADVRFVCATHQPVETLVSTGRLRQDLYYRLRVVEIVIPALRDRGPRDLDRLIDHFLERYARLYKRPGMRLTPAARARLHGHDWPGNVRELEHCVESAVVLSHRLEIDPGDLSLQPSHPTLLPPSEHSEAAPPREGFWTAVRPLREVERDYIRYTLDRFGGNRSAAARTLGIGRNTLIRKLKQED